MGYTTATRHYLAPNEDCWKVGALFTLVVRLVWLTLSMPPVGTYLVVMLPTSSPRYCTWPLQPLLIACYPFVVPTAILPIY